MTVIKQYNTGTAAWEPIVSGVQGPTGSTGPTGPTGATGATGIPTASLQMFAGAITQTVLAGVVTTTAPSGWLLCNGNAVSRTTYSTLFTAISTTFGTGDGTTTFNIPDMSSRMPIGVGTGTGLTARTLAGTGGVETVTLTSAQSGVPAHSHTNTASFSGSFSGTAASHNHTQDAHSHGIQRSNVTASSTNTDGSSIYRLVQNSGASYSDTQNATATNQATSITPAGTISGTVTMTNANNSAANAASSHDNMSPYLGVNFIIKT